MITPEQAGNTQDSEMNLGLSFRGTKIGLTGDLKLDHKDLNELAHLVTGMEVLPKVPDVADCQGILSFQSDSRVKADYDETRRRLELTGPIGKFAAGAAVAHIMNYMAECLRTSDRVLMLVHAAAVTSSENKKSNIIFGEKGAGKTTLAFRLCHESGYRLVGNDQIYLGLNQDRLITAGGDTYFNIRQTACESDEYLSVNFADIPERPLNRPAWNNKRIVRPNEVGITLSTEQADVANIYHVRIDPHESRLKVSTWNNLQRDLFVHEKLGRHVTGQATPLLSDDGEYYGALPPINLYSALSARDSLARSVIKQGITEIFTPDSGTATAYIKSKDG